ncbi:T9SS type A sorting domain-containing protein [Flammeovirga aprica]|uniref:T9SS type A sorting domain-containing protein n=1 Tax=Flammeovirga aprica JL-4 TaxID=694437 RepID=A0A7X9RWR8_9BACT|nr:T9SS type A sorting domain-containing protein [Flammeovirga aprica]NME70132.1 T9SS type A sorting domain-containing protein [Flammeovirga aprica JL-4]
MKRILLTIFVALFSWATLSAQNETDFYTDYLGTISRTVDLVADYNVNNTDAEDDSEALQQAIDDLTALENGGRINIPGGDYFFRNIHVKSNIHLVIHKNATIYPTDIGGDKNFGIFNVGKDKEYTENVSIRGKSGQFTVDVTTSINPNVRVISLINTQNFLVADVSVIDDNTKFSAITMGYSLYNDKYVMSENGVVKNCRIEKAHYGYGLIQSQALKHVFFKDIWGDGGVTLRLETGLKKMNELQVGGNHDIYANNVYCQNGNAGVMISPHATKNGHIEIDGIETVNTGFAARIDRGYVTKKEDSLGITPGYYANTSIVKNVKGTYGKTAQVKSKHFGYVPCQLRHLIGENYNKDGESYPAPAVATVLYRAGNQNNADGYYKVAVSAVESVGFKYQEAIIGEENWIDDCTGVPIEPTDPITPEEPTSKEDLWSMGYQVYPNPTDGIFNVKSTTITEATKLVVFNAQGEKINPVIIKRHQRIKVDISAYPKGLYLVKVEGDRFRILKQ